MLRHRKRGADYDLSDSDDGGEARRRRKRREFAKIRNAILEDERLGKIAENPKKMAFLRAIEDRDEEDEIGFLDDLGEPDDEPISSGESQDKSQVESSQKEVDGAYSKDGSPAGSPKRKRAEDAEPGKRLPPHLRRIMRASRPSNLADIRKTISNLTEDPNAMFHSSTPLVSESEGEDETSDTERSQEKDKENRDPFAARRRPANVAVDRILLKQSSSLTASSATTRLAFAAPSSTPLFKVPALLKRTTTNLSLASTTSTGTTTGTERAAGCSGFGGEGKGMKKAGKNSGVNYFARENERRAKMEETLKKRNEKRLKSAEGRRKVVGGLFAGGKFE
jgi:mediator of replication checkpoint protein 1